MKVDIMIIVLIVVIIIIAIINKKRMIEVTSELKGAYKIINAQNGLIQELKENINLRKQLYDDEEATK